MTTASTDFTRRKHEERMASMSAGTGEPLEPRPAAPRPRHVPGEQRGKRGPWKLANRHTRRLHGTRMGDPVPIRADQYVEPGRISEANGDF